MDTRHDDTARTAIREASHRLHEARCHATFPPDIPARVIGELVLAHEALTTAQDAVARWIGQWCLPPGRTGWWGPTVRARSARANPGVSEAR